MVRNFASRLSISRKILLTSLLGLVLFLGGFLGGFLPGVEEMVARERRLFHKERAELVLSLLNHYESEISLGSLTREQAQFQAAKQLKAVPQNQGEYFWIIGSARSNPRIIVHPIGSSSEHLAPDDTSLGVAGSIRRTSAGKPVRMPEQNPLTAMVGVCLAYGDGYVSHTWPKPVPGGGRSPEAYPKESYVILFKPWDWIIGTGEYMDDLRARITAMRMNAFAFLGLVSALAVAAAGLMARTITRPLHRVVAATQSIAEGNLDVNAGLADTSDELEALSKNFDAMASQLRQREMEREAADAARQESENKMRAVFQNAFQMIWLLTPEGTLLACNASAMAFVEAPKESLLGKPFWDTPWWSGNPDDALRLQTSLAAARTGDFDRFETFFVHPREGTRAIDFSIKTVCDASGRIIWFIPEGRDITEIKSMEGRLTYLSLHDSLTGLANRTLLKDRIRHALQVARRRPDLRQALLYIDINRFRIINDSLGHLAGDTILRDVANRVQGLVREMDTVARYGGDDFVVLLWELTSYREAVGLARRLQEDLMNPLGLPDNPVSLKVSIGIEFMRNHDSEPDDIIRNAHLAMRSCKVKGRNSLKVYTPSLLNRVRTSLTIEREIERAIRNGEFFLMFQPIWDTSLGMRLAGFETLCRWHHPKRGLIPPEAFIPVAEETKLIAPLGGWVLDTACASLAELRRRCPLREDLFVSVNLSPRQLERPDIVQVVRDIVKRHGIPPERVHLEMTETSLMSGNASMNENILRLKRLGVHLVVDDFGMGYSNLSLLTRFRFSAIKIDRSLVWQVETRSENRTIIKAILMMAESLGAQVVVEGIETATQRDTLKAIGCHIHQGFYYSRPGEFEDILAFAVGKPPLVRPVCVSTGQPRHSP